MWRESETGKLVTDDASSSSVFLGGGSSTTTCAIRWMPMSMLLITTLQYKNILNVNIKTHNKGSIFFFTIKHPFFSLCKDLRKSQSWWIVSWAIESRVRPVKSHLKNQTLNHFSTWECQLATLRSAVSNRVGPESRRVESNSGLNGVWLWWMRAPEESVSPPSQRKLKNLKSPNFPLEAWSSLWRDSNNARTEEGEDQIMLRPWRAVTKFIYLFFFFCPSVCILVQIFYQLYVFDGLLYIPTEPTNLIQQLQLVLKKSLFCLINCFFFKYHYISCDQKKKITTNLLVNLTQSNSQKAYHIFIRDT